MANLQLRLSELMSRKNITPTEIEKKTGLNKNTITSILTGASKNPSANTLRSIATSLDVSLEFLLSDNNINIDALTTEQLQLFSEVTTATVNFIIEEKINFSFSKLMAVIKEVYDYTLKKQSIDKIFIDWTVGKHVKS
jgi:transcriptional regulator with XRE-family HTH domain